MLADRKVTLELDDAAKDALVELGYQPALGARPLRRAIVRHVQDPLAEKMLSGDVGEGATLKVRYADDEFRFEP
jgi:ATP-dependent Clp protease ATP-binding subunit ClpB